MQKNDHFESRKKYSLYAHIKKSFDALSSLFKVCATIPQKNFLHGFANGQIKKNTCICVYMRLSFFSLEPILRLQLERFFNRGY
jgi:hypothetical protein